MRYLLIGFIGLLSIGRLMAEDLQFVRLNGQIKDFKGGVVTMIYYEPYRVDTVHVNTDGTFVYSKILEKSGRGTMFFEDYKCTVDLFLENGMYAELDISFEKQKKEGMFYYSPQVNYRGDNADCTTFWNSYMDWSLLNSPWPFERLDTLSFAEYRELYLEDVDSVKRELVKVKSFAFKRMMMEIIDSEIVANLFRFAWSAPKKDVNFECWLESFDRNDAENITVASDYFRWYLMNHPAVSEEEKNSHYLKLLKEVFTNQEIINCFADDYIISCLKEAPDDMESVLALYKTVSTNEDGHRKADAVYEHYKNLKRGGKALDFEMTDRMGKTFHLSDFRGRALYIDVWATWCGPCCAEIPYMKKLAEYYAKNKKIELISISLDENKAKWEKKLDEDKPEWKQFICLDALNSRLCNNYSITGIPRFLFFDKNGRIISLDAPRPSYKNIIEYIDNAIR